MFGYWNLKDIPKLKCHRNFIVFDTCLVLAKPSVQKDFTGVHIRGAL